MNVSEELLKLAAELDKLAGLDLATMPHDALKLTVRSYAFAVRALAGSAAPQESPEDQHRRMIEKAKAEFKGKVRAVDVEQEGGMMMNVECVGGPADQAQFEMPTLHPVGGFARVMGEVYRLEKDGKLHHVGDGK